MSKKYTFLKKTRPLKRSNIDRSDPIYGIRGKRAVFNGWSILFFRSEMIKLDFKTVDKLYEFYKKIIFADNRLLNYYQLSSTDKDAIQRYELQDDFILALIEARAKIPQLKKMLEMNVVQ